MRCHRNLLVVLVAIGSFVSGGFATESNASIVVPFGTISYNGTGNLLGANLGIGETFDDITSQSFGTTILSYNNANMTQTINEAGHLQFVATSGYGSLSLTQFSNSELLLLGAVTAIDIQLTSVGGFPAVELVASFNQTGGTQAFSSTGNEANSVAFVFAPPAGNDLRQAWAASGPIRLTPGEGAGSDPVVPEASGFVVWTLLCGLCGVVAFGRRQVLSRCKVAA